MLDSFPYGNSTLLIKICPFQFNWYPALFNFDSFHIGNGDF